MAGVVVIPGFAKPRSELPWLPYGACDRVIINAHNFNSVFNPAVNGKTPIAAWIPSRDVSGHGTTTLHDLVGSNNGTLTNMDAATDWIADTGAGGSVALDFDGSNDCVRLGSSLNASLVGVLSISGWFKFRSRSAANIFFGNGVAAGVNGFSFEIGRTANKLGWLQNGSSIDATSTGTITDANWHHVMAVRTGSAGSWTITLWIDGVSSAHSTAANPVSAASNGQLTIGRYGDYSAGALANCIADDIRIWNQGLDASDAAWLYNSGSGRGRSS